VIRILLAAVLLSGTALASSPPPPGGIPDIVGARTLALSASIGAAGGNDSMYLNPASIAARKRYAVEGLALFDRRGGTTVDRFLGGSVVDSQTSEVAAGFSYLRAQRGLYEGNVFHGSLGGAIAHGLWIGVGGKYFSVDLQDSARGGTLRDSSSAVTADAGLLWQVTEYVSIGGAGYNLVPIANEAIAPMGAGAGIAIGSDTSFQVTADWRGDFDRADKTRNRYSVGAEALLLRLIPVRAGWMKDEVLDTSWWSAGIGLVTAQGVALDVGYRQSIPDPSARTIAASLRLFLFQ
jgi:hypothetical protein